MSGYWVESRIFAWIQFATDIAMSGRLFLCPYPFDDANISIKIIQWYKSGINLTLFKIKAV